MFYHITNIRIILLIDFSIPQLYNFLIKNSNFPQYAKEGGLAMEHLNNNEIVRRIFQYIKDYMVHNGITQERLSKMCEEKKCNVSQSAISNVLKTPSSSRMTTLLNLCEALGLNLVHIMTAIQNNDFPTGINTGRLIYNSNDPAYNGYIDTFHIYYISTSDDDKAGKMIHGELTTSPSPNTGMCTATLVLHTGDTDSDGTPFIKQYTGNFFISRQHCMCINLRSNEYGDVWNLAFIHNELNKQTLYCSMGVAVTLSAGNPRYPAIHRVCISHEELNENTLDYVRGQLRLSNKNITISKSALEKFKQQNAGNIDQAFLNNLEYSISQSEEYYIVPKTGLKDRVNSESYSQMLALLLSYSEMETNFKIKNDDDRNLRNVICSLNHDTIESDHVD
jgi:hypothetical protein